MKFSIDDQPVDGQTQIVRPAGEIDLAVAASFNERLVELLDAGKKYLVLDLARVRFLDSTALGVLLSGQRRAQAAGGSIALAAIDTNMKRVFEVTGLTSVFGVYPSVDDALSSRLAG